jgi:hypothetical protein
VYNSLTKKLASSPLFASTIIFAAGFFLFTGALFNHEFVQFEARFGLFAQEMFRNGLSFFPTTYNHYYPDYPATQTILTYFLALAIGNYSYCRYTHCISFRYYASVDLLSWLYPLATFRHLWRFICFIHLYFCA